MSNHQEPEVSIKSVPQSLTSGGDRAAGSGPTGNSGGTQMQLICSRYHLKTFRSTRYPGPWGHRPGRCRQDAMVRGHPRPPRVASQETLTPGQSYLPWFFKHPPPPTHSRSSAPSLTLVVGDVTAVAWPCCQQRQEETKLQKKFPDFAAPHGSPRLSSPLP